MANNGLTTKVKTKISTKTIILVAVGLAILGAAFGILPSLQPSTPPAPIARIPALVSLSVAPFSIVVGEKATLTAYVDSAKSCTPTGIPEIDKAMIGLTQNGNINQGTHSFSTKATVSPKTTTTYTLTCIGANDNLPKSAQAKLIVIQCVGGANTTNATLCPLEDSNVTTATPKTLVTKCSGLPAKCEFTCNQGYTMGPLQQKCIQCYSTGQNAGRLGSCCPGLIKNAAGVCVAPQCTGITPENSILCPGDDVGLNANTPKRLVAQCNDLRKCQYTCNQGFIYSSAGRCVAQPSTLKIIDINGGDSYTGTTKEIDATTYVKATCSMAYSKNSDTSNGTTILGKIVQTPAPGNDSKYYYAFNLTNLDGVSTYYYKIMCNIPGQAVASAIKTLKPQGAPGPTFSLAAISPSGMLVPGLNTLLAVFNITADLANDITFVNGSGNSITFNIQSTCNAGSTGMTLKDETGKTLDLKASYDVCVPGAYSFNFADSNLIIPKGTTKRIYLYANTSGAKTVNDSMQVILFESPKTNVQWSINNDGSNHATADITFRGNIYANALVR